MDLRVLKYFVTVVHEECITAAAEKLNVTQPTLSRQLKELEEELGTQLFNRGSRSRRITLTPKGAILRRRAEELLALAGKTVQEVSSEGSVEGTIYLGITESAAEALLCKAAAQVRERYPDIGFELTSGLSCDLAAALDKGVLDFACFPADTELSEYETVSLPGGDLWGVAVPPGNALAAKGEVCAEDLLELRDLLLSWQCDTDKIISKWLGGKKLKPAGRFNSARQALSMVRAGGWNALCMNCDVSADDPQAVFVPLKPELKTGSVLAWRRGIASNPVSEAFLKQVKSLCGIH
ncbi:MAG: LysR family transcriptional regulator [Succinivibrio sp.]|jgi:DNA-binding transcriptional LysR family regulator|nr:LysR family transcriptional regulator [Succinivibrio sp.]